MLGVNYDELSNQVQHFARFSWNKSCGVRKCKTFFDPELINAGFFQSRGTDPRKIPAFRVKLPQQSVLVLVRPFLPCAVRIGKIHIALQRFLVFS